VNLTASLARTSGPPVLQKESGIHIQGAMETSGRPGTDVMGARDLLGDPGIGPQRLEGARGEAAGGNLPLVVLVLLREERGMEERETEEKRMEEEEKHLLQGTPHDLRTEGLVTEGLVMESQRPSQEDKMEVGGGVEEEMEGARTAWEEGPAQGSCSSPV